MIQRIHELSVPTNGRAAHAERRAPAPAPPTLDATPRAAAVLLAGATGLVAALGTISAVCKYPLGIAHGPLDVITLLDVRAEAALPAWYSSVLLLLAGLLLALVAWLTWSRGQRFARHWLVLGLIFLLLSADETIQFHERAAWPLERVLRFKGAFLYGWVIPALGFVLIVGLSYLKFLAHLAPRTRRLFVLSGLIYVGAALGLEMVEGVYATRWGDETGAYMAMVVVEEVMEMAGVTLFIYALLAHLRDAWGGVTFHLAPRAAIASAPAPRAAEVPTPYASPAHGFTAVPSDPPPPSPAGPPRPAPRDRAVA